MSTSWPFCTSSRAPAGVSATRYSSVLISLATPIRTARGQYRVSGVRWDGMAVALAAVALALAPLPGVVTPSGNIHCFYVPAKPAHLLCDIHQASYSVREQDACMARAGLD